MDNLSGMLSDVLQEFAYSRGKIACLKNYKMTGDILDEVISSLDGTRDIRTLNIISERNYQAEIIAALTETCEYVTDITGFKCGPMVIEAKNFPGLKSSMMCYCPKLKLNFYFETLYKVPTGREFVYYDITPNSMYARLHDEYTTIHEVIRLERKIYDYEIHGNYLNKSSKERREYILDVIKQFTSVNCYVGGHIDPRFPLPEPMEESDSDTEEKEKDIMMQLVDMMVNHPDNPKDFEGFDDFDDFDSYRF